MRHSETWPLILLAAAVIGHIVFKIVVVLSEVAW